MVINETTGNVEIAIRDYFTFMMRMDSLIERVEQLLDEIPAGSSAAVMNLDDKIMSLDEFIAFTTDWLTEKGKFCAVFRFAGKWSHVNVKQVVVGAWDTVDEAIDATSCDNSCSPQMFRFD